LSLPTYMRIAAVVFVVFGMVGFAVGWFGYSGFFGPGVAENGMHVGVGLLFAYFGFSRSPHANDRYFAGGVGVLLLLGKGVIPRHAARPPRGREIDQNPCYICVAKTTLRNLLGGGVYATVLLWQISVMHE
jgi:hypothetical protein